MKIITLDEAREMFAGCEIVDRYSVLGIPRPDPKTICDGFCEGTGIVPIKQNDKDPVFQKLWEEAEAKEHADDGWHFVTCPICHGTGRKPGMGNVWGHEV